MSTEIIVLVCITRAKTNSHQMSICDSYKKKKKDCSKTLIIHPNNVVEAIKIKKITNNQSITNESIIIKMKNVDNN